jgi:hypothetical protein
MGSIFATWGLGYPWFASLACDIDFGHNPWGETVNNGNAAGDWMSSTGFLFKILNDSIKLGLKPATDPNDFQLIDIFGDGKDPWQIGGVPAEQTAIPEKPDWVNHSAQTRKIVNGYSTTGLIGAHMVLVGLWTS